MMSVITTDCASEGPGLVTVIVYWTCPPGSGGFVSNTFVIPKSVVGATGVEIVVVRGGLVAVGGVELATVAVFSMLAVAPAATVVSMVMVTTSPTSSEPRSHDTVASQVDPSSEEAETPLSSAGTGSPTMTSFACDGPLFVTTIS